MLSLFCGKILRKIDMRWRHEQEIAFLSFRLRLQPYLVNFLFCPLITQRPTSKLLLTFHLSQSRVKRKPVVIELFLLLYPVSLIPGPTLCVHFGACDFFLGTCSPSPVWFFPNWEQEGEAVKTDLLQLTDCPSDKGSFLPLPSLIGKVL